MNSTSGNGPRQVTPAKAPSHDDKVAEKEYDEEVDILPWTDFNLAAAAGYDLNNPDDAEKYSRNSRGPNIRPLDRGRYRGDELIGQFVDTNGRSVGDLEFRSAFLDLQYKDFTEMMQDIEHLDDVIIPYLLVCYVQFSGMEDQFWTREQMPDIYPGHFCYIWKEQYLDADGYPQPFCFLGIEVHPHRFAAYATWYLGMRMRTAPPRGLVSAHT